MDIDGPERKSCTNETEGDRRNNSSNGKMTVNGGDQMIVTDDLKEWPQLPSTIHHTDVNQQRACSTWVIEHGLQEYQVASKAH